MGDNDLTEEELAAMTAVLLSIETAQDMRLEGTKIREVWPKPSPWRWAMVGC